MAGVLLGEDVEDARGTAARGVRSGGCRSIAGTSPASTATREAQSSPAPIPKPQASTICSGTSCSGTSSPRLSSRIAQPGHLDRLASPRGRQGGASPNVGTSATRWRPRRRRARPGQLAARPLRSCSRRAGQPVSSCRRLEAAWHCRPAAGAYQPPITWPPPLTYRETRRLAARVMPGARCRRLYWRYSLIRTKRLNAAHLTRSRESQPGAGQVTIIV